MKAAALTSSLLARKGSAAPADLTLVPLKRPAAPRRVPDAPAIESPAPAGTLAPDAGPVGPAATQGCCLGAGAAEAVRHEVAKLTLRLDKVRHLRLKLLAAHMQLSLQDLLVRALDSYVDQVAVRATRGQCSCLAQLEEAARLSLPRGETAE